MLLDASVLISADRRETGDGARVAEWLAAALNGDRRVGVPWQSLATFLRISTHPRIYDRPRSPAAAWERISSWLAVPIVWVPEPGPGYAEILGPLVEQTRPTGNLVPDTMLAALAIEHGLTLVSLDSDFARFPRLSWINPLAA